MFSWGSGGRNWAPGLRLGAQKTDGQGHQGWSGSETIQARRAQARAQVGGRDLTTGIGSIEQGWAISPAPLFQSGDFSGPV